MPKAIHFYPPEGFDFANYITGEEQIIKPWLEKQGCSNIRFVSGERDSFGPLSRQVLVTHDGQQKVLWYG